MATGRLGELQMVFGLPSFDLLTGRTLIGRTTGGKKGGSRWYRSKFITITISISISFQISYRTHKHGIPAQISKHTITYLKQT